MKLTIIGAGKMGEALARGMLHAGLLVPQDLTLADVAGEQVQALATVLGAQAVTENAVAVNGASVVILAVKPSIVPIACQQIALALAPQTTVLSIAAGVTLRQVAVALQRDDVILARAMPNTPCLVGAGAIGLSLASQAPASARETLVRLLSSLGLVVEVPEALLDAVTALSGSGPAYIAILMEALADGGVLMGLPRATAEQLAAQTVMGTARLVQETGQHPAQVKDAVSSPGGTTIAGIAALEEQGFRNAIISAVRAAAMRARALSGE